MGSRATVPARGRTGRGTKKTRHAATTSAADTPNELVECHLLQEAPRIWVPRCAVELLTAAGRVCVRAPRRHERRCTWAEEALAAAVPHLEKVGIFQPPGRRLCVEFAPLENAAGQCSILRADLARIEVTTRHSAVEDPRTLVHVLIHEQLHAADDCRSGHAGQWAWWAGRILGMQARGYTRNAACDRIITRILRELGPLPPLDAEAAS